MIGRQRVPLRAHGEMNHARIMFVQSTIQMEERRIHVAGFTIEYGHLKVRKRLQLTGGPLQDEPSNACTSTPGVGLF